VLVVTVEMTFDLVPVAKSYLLRQRFERLLHGVFLLQYRRACGRRSSGRISIRLAALCRILDSAPL
jgi:hypothetical protein